MNGPKEVDINEIYDIFGQKHRFSLQDYENEANKLQINSDRPDESEGLSKRLFEKPKHSIKYRASTSGRVQSQNETYEIEETPNQRDSHN